MSNILAQIDTISSSIQNVYSNITNITQNTLFNYNQITKTSYQRVNDYNTIYNGTGNLIVGNLQVNSNANIIGNLIVDNGTLYIDSLNNKIGILNTNPQYTLDISGNANISQNAFIKNSIGINTNNTSANLHIEGNLLINGNLNIDNGTLWVDDINNRIGILNTNPQYTLDILGDANISSNVIVNNDANIKNSILNGLNYHYYSVNNVSTIRNIPSTIRKINFLQRYTISAAVTSNSYNLCKLTYELNNSIIIVAQIDGHLYYGPSTSTGLYQENIIVINYNNTNNDTSVSNISNGIPRVISKNTSSTFTSCNFTVDTTTGGEAIIKVTPIFTGTQTFSSSALVIDWTIILANNSDITTIETYINL